MRAGACIGVATMPQPWTLRLIFNDAASKFGSRQSDFALQAVVECVCFITAESDKSLTGEPILPSRTANQYLARHWFAVRDGKIGSPVRDLSGPVCVCFITAGPITKLFAWGGRRVEDMCYERRRAEACVDESAHHSLGPVRNPVL